MTKTGARIVVVGGGYAGVIAAQRLARGGGGVGARVTLVSAGDELVNRIRLHEVAAGSEPRRRPLARLLRRTGAEVRVARVARVDADRRRLVVDGGDVVDYDFLVLATGSETDLGVVPGAAEFAHALSGYGAARAVRAAAERGGRLVVCGGGATAVEAASELAERMGPRGLRVGLVARGRVLACAGERAREHALAVLARLGVEVAEDTNVAAVERDALVTSAGRMAFDTCVWAGGFVASRLARDSGLPVDARGQLRVDATLAVVGHPSVYAAGDAAHPTEHEGARVDMSCKTALPMGATAAANVLAELRGAAPRPFGFGDTGMCISLGRRDGAIAIRRRDGSDSGRLVRGRAAAWIKEGVCRFVTGTLAVERVLPVYRWLAPQRQLPAPVAS